MAGHSKWANIKRQKARVDAVRGKVFAKISRELIVAARSGSDPAGNFQLRTAVEKAKAAGMPSANIDRAIAKGSGTFSGDDPLEAIRYEGYGPGGVAVLIEALTDNRNRTAADLRAALSKNGGNLGETGCVGWMFEQQGVVTVIGDAIDEEALLEASLEGDGEGYEAFEGEDDKGFEIAGFEVKSAPDALEGLENALRGHGFRVWRSELRWVPTNTLEVTDPDHAKYLLRMMDAIEDLDDVQSVTANFEMTDELMAATLG
ncbi:MAG: YebC/PmpR family DNA-binding transcriptional regulator [Cyanobacteria bacterium]|nr:YebC/PmpR family DNA-binding transcriptional regulator [Cyanobacteriota bacterium]